MPFCPSCGKEVARKAIYCPYCGSQVRKGADEDWKAGMGLDLLLADSSVQMNWASRLVAYIIDSFIVGVAAFVVGWLLTFPLIIGALFRGGSLTWRGFFGLPFSIGLVQVFYFTLAEGGYGASIGKQVMGLKVTDIEGNPVSFAKALVRNISKVFWALLLLDVFIGLFSLADPRQKYTDQIAGTRVVSLRKGLFARPVPRPEPKVKLAIQRPKEREDPLGWVNVGVTVIIIASVFILHPDIFPEIITWIEGWREIGPTMIPNMLMEPLIWFFSILGVWSLTMAVIRIASGIHIRKSVSDAFGGVFLLTVAFLFREYNARLMPLTVLLPVLVIAFGVFVLVSSAASYLLHDRF